MFWLSKDEDQISTMKIEEKVFNGRDWIPKSSTMKIEDKVINNRDQRLKSSMMKI